MTRSVTTARTLLRRLTRDVPGTSKQIASARRRKMMGEGTGSFFLWPIQAIARKAVGRSKVDKALYQRLHRPLTNIDQKTGKLLEREFGTKKLFRQVDVLPSGRKIGGQEALLKHERHSATAPLGKAVKTIAPLAAVLYASQLMSKKEQEKVAESTGKEALLIKAATALEWAGRRQVAEELAFEMIEQGRISPFGTFDDFQEKIANLMERDLNVVREALEIDVSVADFGKLAEDGSSSSSSPEEIFFHTLAD